MWRKTMLALTVVAVLSAPVLAEEGEEPPIRPLTVAVLDFSAGAEEAKGLASSLPDLLEVSLSSVPNLRLVTRRELDRIQKEQEPGDEPPAEPDKEPS